MYSDASVEASENDRRIMAEDLARMRIRPDPESEMYVYLDYEEDSGRRLEMSQHQFPIGYDVVGDDPVRGSIIGWITTDHR